MRAIEIVNLTNDLLYEVLSRKTILDVIPLASHDPFNECWIGLARVAQNQTVNRGNHEIYLIVNVHGQTNNSLTQTSNA